MHFHQSHLPLQLFPEGPFLCLYTPASALALSPFHFVSWTHNTSNVLLSPCLSLLVTPPHRSHIQTSHPDFVFGSLPAERSTRISLISHHYREAQRVSYPGRGNYIDFLYNNKIKNNNNKMTSLAPISSENRSSEAQQNQRIRHSRVHVQCKKSSTDGWRCQEAKEDRQFFKDKFSDYGELKLYFLLILRCGEVNSTELVRQPRKFEFQPLS